MMTRLFTFIAFLVAINVVASAQTIKGKVVSAADGMGLPGVTVTVKGASGGAITDGTGNYSINAASNSTLLFSYIGYTNLEVAVAGRTVVNVEMEEDETQLDEVVVTALGIEKDKRNIGYATTMIDSKELVKTATPNVATSLYGKAPGVNIQATPGGATSGVSISIRGFSSITGNTQPLIVINGIPMRNGQFNNLNYWGDQRIRGNGLNDINPEDIESISVLKGASAAALYGSEAVNGVILITTKSGKGAQGLGVDFNASYTNDKIAYLPRYQNVRGPGYPLQASDQGQGEDGFLTNDDGTRGLLNYGFRNFGPKFDGQPVKAWTGEMVPYVSSNGGYDQLFQDANSSNINLAVTHGGDNGNIRLSYTRQDNQMISRNSKNEKNVFSLASSFAIGKRSNTNVNIQYINQMTKNRPFKVDRMINNFGGMMDRFEHGSWYLDRAITSLGYQYRIGAQPSLTPDENINGNLFKKDIMDYAYQVLARNYVENSNRIIASIGENFKIGNGFSIRGRLATDFTAEKIEDKRPTEAPLTLAVPSGLYRLDNNNYNLVYGDVYLQYEKTFASDYEVKAFAGYTARKEAFYTSFMNTLGGLTTENFFDIRASRLPPNAYQNRVNNVLDAWLGSIDFTYKGFWNVQATLRQDRTSTMHPDNNSFFYPSVNTAFIISDAFSLPQSWTYSKLRASWGIVGNYPSPYQANIAFTQGNLLVQNEGASATVYTQLPNSNYGNDNIKPEQKHEIEIGLENYFFGRRLGIDLSYYNAQIRDQILPLTLPATSGTRSILANIGTLRNQGFEVALTGTPIEMKGFRWEIILNAAKNSNKVEKLANGLTELIHDNQIGTDGNAFSVRSIVGRPMGDILVPPIATDEKGNKIVDPNGLYRLDQNNWRRAANAMPDWTGGFINNLEYKGFDLSLVTSFQIGGAVMPTGIGWMTSRGLTEESLNAMDTEHGGLSYYLDASGKGVQTSASVGPNGETVYHDGMLMEGVTADGVTNTNVISQAFYYNATYNWGGPQYGNARYELFLKKNHFWKMREISLGYSLPKSFAKRVGANNLHLSIFGRNLFFLYRNIKDIDPEQTVMGSNWVQNIKSAGNNPAFRTYGVMLRANF